MTAAPLNPPLPALIVNSRKIFGSTLSQRLTELIISQGDGKQYKGNLSRTSLKHYINLLRDETLEKVNAMSCVDFAEVVQELGPFYESKLDEVTWNILTDIADFATFEAVWLRLSFPQRARLRLIAPGYFLTQEFFLQAVRIKTLAPDLTVKILDPKGPNIEQLIEVVHSRYKPLTLNDLPRLLAKRPEELTYHEICAISLLDSPQKLSKILHTLDSPKAELIRERMKKGEKAVTSAYMMSREIRLMRNVLRAVEIG
jgi:hypothetical protein